MDGAKAAICRNQIARADSIRASRERQWLPSVGLDYDRSVPKEVLPMKSITTAALLSVVSIASALAQNKADKPAPKVFLCDESAGCTHQFIDGQKFKILTGDGITVVVSLAATPKYLRVDVSVSNGTSSPVDVLPEEFDLEESAPKQKRLAYVDAEKVIRSAQRRVALGNALTAMGGNMARQQSTTTTYSNGTMNASSSNGTYANGTYNGTSTARTSSPDYAAQARADETIRQRNAALASLSGQLSHTVLRDNSVLPNQTVRGVVLFDLDKKAESGSLSIPIAGLLYKFPIIEKRW